MQSGLKKKKKEIQTDWDENRRLLFTCTLSANILPDAAFFFNTNISRRHDESQPILSKILHIFHALHTHILYLVKT